MNAATNVASVTEPEQKRDTRHAHHVECAQEKIQVIGHIQSHGILFALSEPDLNVRHVSANVSDLLGVFADDILGRPFLHVIGIDQLAALQSSIRGNEAFFAMLVSVPMRDGPCELPCVIHRQGGMLIVEFELVSADQINTKHDIDTEHTIPIIPNMGFT